MDANRATRDEPWHEPCPILLAKADHGDDPYWPLKQAAGVVRCHHRTLRRAIKAGRLVAFQRGGRRGAHVFVRHSNLLAWAYPAPADLREPAPNPGAPHTPSRRRSSPASPPDLISERFDEESIAAYGMRIHRN